MYVHRCCLQIFNKLPTSHVNQLGSRFCPVLFSLTQTTIIIKLTQHPAIDRDYYSSCGSFILSK